MGRKYYWLAVVASLLGSIGAAADVSWHFSRLFDEFSPPHDIATVGFLLNIGLLYWALWRHRTLVKGAERLGLLINATGVAIYLIAIPLDLTWHLIFGIDITTWSPTHLMLFYSAVIGQVGMIVAWLASRDRGSSGAWAITLSLCALLLSQVLFPLYQQEYAAVALVSLQQTGLAPWYVAPDMWALAGRQAEKVARGGLPDGLYITYQALLAAAVFTLAAILVRASVRWTDERRGRGVNWWSGAGAATGLAAVYLLFRVIMRGIFLLVGMPRAVVPLWLLPLAIAVDAAMLLAVVMPELRVPSWLPFPHGTLERTKQEVIFAALGGFLGAAALYGTLAGLDLSGVTVPDTPAGAAIVALFTGALGGACGTLLATRIVRVVGLSPEEMAPLPLSGAANRLREWGQAAMAQWGARRR